MQCLLVDWLVSWFVILSFCWRYPVQERKADGPTWLGGPGTLVPVPLRCPSGAGREFSLKKFVVVTERKAG